MRAFKLIRPRFLLALLLLACSVALAAAPANAGDDWKMEFNAICGKTHNALSFSPEELNDLIGRCDDLKLRIEKLGESQSSERKVFLQRLKMCREFYAFALSTKNDNGKK